MYCQPQNADATTAKHYPAELAGTLMVTPSAYGCQQEYTTYSTRQKFVRGLVGAWNGKDGPWSDWAAPPAYGWGMGPQHRDDAYNNTAMVYRVNTSSANAPPITGNIAAGIVSVPCDAAPSTGYLAVSGMGDGWLGHSGAAASGVTWTRIFTEKNPPTAVVSQAADWRNNFAARLGIARVLTGANKPTSPGVWAVENSTWTPVAWGTLYVTTNNSDLSVPSANGKYIHYLFIAHGATNKFFVATDVNGQFVGWEGYLPTKGGAVSGPTTFGQDVTVGGDAILKKNNKWIKQTFDGTAGNNMTWRYWGDADRPSVCELDIDGGIWLFSIERTKDNKAALGVNGVVNCEGVTVGNARMAADGNIWGTRWNANGQWLWDAITELVNGRAGKFTASTGQSGWRRDPDTGIVEQWMYCEGNHSGAPQGQWFNFPIAFPSRCDNVQLTCLNSTNAQSTYPPQVSGNLPSNTGVSVCFGSNEYRFLVYAVGV
ncbi:hypothetical protein D3C79_419780 [compost metagenome]